jgi:hypothetical protein
MIDAIERQRIQAEAYKKMVKTYDQVRNWDEVGNALHNIIEDTNKELAVLQNRWNEIKHELDRTRFKRLPQTQFMYWPGSGHPRIVQRSTAIAPGDYSYLQEQAATRTVESAQLLEALLVLEIELFAAYGKDEVKVFWRGWEAYTVEGTSQVVAVCNYCVAYLWDNGYVQTEPSSYWAPRSYNLNNSADRAAIGFPPIQHEARHNKPRCS